MAIAAGRVELADGSHIAAGVIINAAGAAATRLTPELPIRQMELPGPVISDTVIEEFRQTEIVGFQTRTRPGAAVMDGSPWP